MKWFEEVKIVATGCITGKPREEFGKFGKGITAGRRNFELLSFRVPELSLGNLGFAEMISQWK